MGCGPGLLGAVDSDDGTRAIEWDDWLFGGCGPEFIAKGGGAGVTLLGYLEYDMMNEIAEWSLLDGMDCVRSSERGRVRKS